MSWKEMRGSDTAGCPRAIGRSAMEWPSSTVGRCIQRRKVPIPLRNVPIPPKGRSNLRNWKRGKGRKNGYCNVETTEEIDKEEDQQKGQHSGGKSHQQEEIMVEKRKRDDVVEIFRMNASRNTNIRDWIGQRLKAEFFRRAENGAVFGFNGPVHFQFKKIP